MKDGGPAFPAYGHVNENGIGVFHDDGMSLRDYFAGQALAGLLASDSWSDNNVSAPDNGSSIPEVAYEVADAMIAERERASE